MLVLAMPESPSKWVKVAVPHQWDPGTGYGPSIHLCAGGMCHPNTPIPALVGDNSTHSHMLRGLREMLSWVKLRFVCREGKRWDLAVWEKLRASRCP